ncbi:flippase [Clostridium sp.]|uniref:flippase n=1 Tax=Clostridium sp. TaxID=1506 RepID=UPI0025889B62|nr:flippase [Clostridium sp.]MCI6140661.1 flippase [Clostridium sp.]
MNKKSIKHNYIYNLTYQIFILLVPFITTPYLSRVLGADGVGLNSYTNSIVTYFVLIAVLGTSDYGQREIAYRQDGVKERSRMFWEVFILRGLTSLASLGMFLLVTWDSDYRLLYFLQSVNIISVMVDISWFFQGMEEFGKIAVRNIIVKILNISVIFAMVKTSNDLPMYIASISISALVGHISIWSMLPQYICSIPLKEIKPFRNIKRVMQLFLPQIAIQVSAVMDKTMLGMITGSEFENGYYEQADRIEKLCLTIVSSLGIVMIPRISYVVSKRQSEMLDYYIYRSYRFVWFIALPLTFGLIGIADQFVPWFFGMGYEKTIILIRIVSVLLCIVGVSSVTGVQYLIPSGKQNQFTLSVVLGMVVNFCMNALLIRNYLSIGAAAATVAGELAVTISQLVMVRKCFSIKKLLSLSRIYLVASMFMCMVILIIKPLVEKTAWGTVLLVCTGGTTYMLSLLGMKDELVVSLLQKMRIRRPHY